MKLLKKINDSQWLLYSTVFCVVGILVIVPFYINNHKKVVILEKKLDSINVILNQNESIFNKRQRDYDQKSKKQKVEIENIKTEILKQIE